MLIFLNLLYHIIIPVTSTHFQLSDLHLPTCSVQPELIYSALNTQPSHLPCLCHEFLTLLPEYSLNLSFNSIISFSHYNNFFPFESKSIASYHILFYAPCNKLGRIAFILNLFQCSVGCIFKAGIFFPVIYLKLYYI